jgi:uncharacterized protein YxjI
MRYIMRQRLFAFGDDFYITDESGRDLFFVDGRAFSLGDKLAFKDLAGNELAFIRQRLLSFTSTYEIARDGQPFATIQKSMFTLFRAHFTVDVPGPDDLEAQGDFLDHEYSFTRHGAPVAQVSKRWFSLGDTYGVDVAEGEDDVLILACTVVIDMVAQDAQERRQNT